jgi:hypothetical protein
MAYTPYYAPYSRPMGYYNPSIPQDMSNMQTNQQMPMPQQMQQMPIQSNLAPMQMPTQQTNDVMLWVLNENEASSFPVAPNNSVVLWDKNNKTFYIKTANAQGIPSMQIYDFTERIEKPQNEPTTHKCTCGDKFVTKAEFDALKGKFYDLQARYDAITIEEKEKPVEKPKTTSKKTNESEE